MNKDGKITVAEFREFIKQKTPTHLFLTFMDKHTKKSPFRIPCYPSAYGYGSSLSVNKRK